MAVNPVVTTENWGRYKTILKAIVGQDVLSTVEAEEFARVIEKALVVEEEQRAKRGGAATPQGEVVTPYDRGREISRRLGKAASLEQIERIQHFAPEARVYVCHERAKDLQRRGGWPLAPKGGSTFVWIAGPNGETLATGTARCSEEDQFCRRTGLEIALKRAILELESHKGLSTSDFARERFERAEGWANSFLSMASPFKVGDRVLGKCSSNVPLEWAGIVIGVRLQEDRWVARVSWPHPHSKVDDVWADDLVPWSPDQIERVSQ